MLHVHYSVDTVPSGEKRGNCPICRKDALLHYYLIRGAGYVAGRVYECTTCSTRQGSEFGI